MMFSGQLSANGFFAKENPVIKSLVEKANAHFDAMDVDKNGIVTEQESLLWRQNRFKELDANKDGIITEGEYMGFLGRELKDKITDMTWRRDVRKDFRRLDRNLDTKVSRKEWLAPSFWFVALYDHDDNKEVSREEFVGSMTFKYPPRNILKKD